MRPRGWRGSCRLLLAACLALVSLGGTARGDVEMEFAKQHFAKGRELYLAGDYGPALAQFEAARRYKPVAAFDHHIARCLDRLGRIPEAIKAYEHYATEERDPIEAGRARERARELRSATAPTRPGTLPKPVPAWARAAPSRGTASTLRMAAIDVGAAALIVAVVGSALYGVAAAGYDDFRLRWDQAQPGQRGELRDEGQSMQSMATAGYALWSIAGVLAAVDVVLWGLDLGRPRRDRAVSIAPSAGGLVLGGTF